MKLGLKGKIFITFIVITLLTLCGIFTYSVHVNTLGTTAKKEKSKEIVNQYLKAKYPNEAFSVGEIQYNTKFGYYGVGVSPSEAGASSFRIKLGQSLSWLEDTRLTDNLTSDLRDELKKILFKVSPTIQISNNFDTCNVSPDIIINDNFKAGVIHKDYFDIQLYSKGSVISKDLFSKICKDSLEWIKVQNYNFDGACITYFTESNKQHFELTINNKDDINLSQESLISKIKEETIAK